MTRAPFMLRRRAPKHTGGFTLLEVLVAIALLAVLLSSVYAFIWNLFDRQTRTLDEAAESQAATMIFDRLEADLMSAVASAGDGAGVSGDRFGVVIAHRAVLPGSPSAPVSDLQETTIRFDRRAGRISMNRVDPGSVDVRAAVEAYPVPVRAARFRYYTGSGWTDRFSSEQGLPSAVELAIWFGMPADADDLGEDSLGFERADPDRFGPIGGIEQDAGFGNFDGANDDVFGAMDAGGMNTGAMDGSPAGLGEEDDLPPPDRVRVITIPDARVPRATRRALERGTDE